MSTNQLPDVTDVDPEEITEPVLTRQGWITPAPDSVRALHTLYCQAAAMSPESGAKQVALENAERMHERLLARYAGNPQRLARLAEVRAEAGRTN